jgi:hypothetical protein
MRKMYIRVKEDEPEDLLSDVEPEAEPVSDSADQQPPDSPDEVPLQIDEGKTPVAKTTASKSGPEQGQSVPIVPAVPQPEQQQQRGDAIPVPVSSSPVTQAKSSEPPKSGTPVQRNKIAQNLKKTLVENRRSHSQSASDAEDGTTPCPADAVQITKLKAEIASLKRELNAERAKHMKAMDAEKKRLEAVIADMHREKEQALQKEGARLRKEHEDNLRVVKQKQWCANCGRPALFYCCWNNSYCDSTCQIAHWPVHMAHCQQTRQNAADNMA